MTQGSLVARFVIEEIGRTLQREKLKAEQEKVNKEEKKKLMEEQEKSNKKQAETEEAGETAPSIAFPNGSVPIVNLRSDLNQHFATGSTIQDKSATPSSSMADRKRPRSESSPSDLASSMGLRLPHARSTEMDRQTIDPRKLTKRTAQVPIDPLLLHHDRNMAVHTGVQNTERPHTPTLPPFRSNYQVDPASGATVYRPYNYSVPGEPSSDATISPISPAPVRARPVAEPTSPLSNQIQREMSYSGQHGIAAETTQLLPLPVYQNPRSNQFNSAQSSYDAYVARTKARLSKMPIARGRVSSEQGARWSKTPLIGNHEHQSCHNRQLPASVSQQHEQQVRPGGTKEEFVPSTQEARTLEDNDALPPIWRPYANSHTVLYSNDENELLHTAQRAKEKVASLKTSSMENQWVPGVDWTSKETISNTITDQEKRDIEILFPELAKRDVISTPVQSAKRLEDLKPLSVLDQINDEDQELEEMYKLDMDADDIDKLFP